MAYILSPLPGQYHESTLVSIESLGVDVCYTTDGSVPTALDAYTAPFSIDKTCTINVLALADIGNVANMESFYYTVDPVVTKILLTQGPIANLPVNADGTLLPTDVNMLFAADDSGKPQPLSDVYIGPHQPLAGTKLWHDTSTMAIKYNNGKAWVPTLSAAQTKNFGEFNDVLTTDLPFGVYGPSDAITITSELAYPIRYTTDGSRPTETSTLYTGPIPMFTGILRAISIGDAPAVEIQVTYALSSLIRFIPRNDDTNTFDVTIDVSTAVENYYVYYNYTSREQILSQDINYYNQSLTGNGKIVAFGGVFTDSWSYDPEMIINIELCKLDGTVVDSAVLPWLPPVPNISASGTVIALDRPLGGYNWYLCATKNGVEPLVINSLGRGIDSVQYFDIARYVPTTGTWKVKLIYYNENMPIEFAAKTLVDSKTLTITINAVTPPVLYTGLEVEFSKTKADDPFTFYDILTESVTLTRGNSGGPLINLVAETTYDSSLSPKGIFFAFADHNGNSEGLTVVGHKDAIFAPFVPAIRLSPPDVVDRPCIAYIPAQNIYFEMRFDYWGQGADGEEGTVTYRRSQLPAVTTTNIATVTITPDTTPAPIGPNATYWVGTEVALGAALFDSVDGRYEVDSITSSVELRRGATGLLYNRVSELAYANGVSPVGVKFAFSGLGPNAARPVINATAISEGTVVPVFSDMKTACANNTTNLIGVKGVMYLELDNIYVDVVFTRWSGVQNTGGFSYTRATAISTATGPTTTVTIVDRTTSGGVFKIDNFVVTPGTYELVQGEHYFTFETTYPNGTNIAGISYDAGGSMWTSIASVSNSSGNIATGFYSITDVPVTIGFGSFTD